MASDPIITVENLSKRYQLGTAQPVERYTALRDVITRKAQGLFRRPPRDGSGRTETGEFWALRDVSFEVGRGEVVGIIGRNGAGKSTLLKILSRITEPTSGRISLKGRVASLLEVGTGFHPELTGRENIFLNGAILGMHRAEIKAKFDEIVAFAEVEKFLDTPVKRYSSGMYVRLAFAVAAHLEPEILVVDEVLAVGDAEFQKKCLGKMHEIAQGGGRTVLFVSHNMSSVIALCSQCIYLKQGCVLEKGPVESVVTKYIEEGFRAGELTARLVDKPRAGQLGSKLKINSVTILADKDTIRYRDKLIIFLEVSAFADVEQVFVGIGVNSITAQRLFTVEADEVKYPILRNKESIRISVEIPEPALPPGRYTLEVGVNAGTGLGLDYVPDALSFVVVPSSDEMLYTERTGLGLRPRSIWNHTLVAKGAGLPGTDTKVVT